MGSVRGGRSEHAPYLNVSIRHCTITKIKLAMIQKNCNINPVSHQRKAAMGTMNAATSYSDWSKLTQEVNWHQISFFFFFVRVLYCASSQTKQNSLCNTSDRSVIKITTNCSEAETFRTPQCDVRHQKPCRCLQTTKC